MLWKTWSSGVDWLTLTADTDTREARKLEAEGGKLVNRAAQTGERIEAGQWYGYRGLQCGKFFVGSGHNGILVQATGGDAHAAAVQLMETAHGCKVARIDLQVTAKGQSDHPRWAREEYEALAKRNFRTPQGRQVAGTLHFSDKRGDSVTIGSRTSARHLVLYDKSREQGGDVEPHLFRYEARHRGRKGMEAWKAVCRSQNPATTARDIVAAVCADLGIDMAWCDESELQRLPCENTKSTPQRTIDWFSTSVRPALLKAIDAGFDAEVMAALEPILSRLNEDVRNSRANRVTLRKRGN